VLGPRGLCWPDWGYVDRRPSKHRRLCWDKNYFQSVRRVPGVFWGGIMCMFGIFVSCCGAAVRAAATAPAGGRNTLPPAGQADAQFS